MGFRLLEHTADVRAECRAARFEELLVVAAQALNAVALHEVRAQTDTERKIEALGSTPEDLLIRWLQELIFLMDVEHFVGVEFDISCESTRVLAKVRGYLHGPEERAIEIKAATYHDLKIRESDGGLVVNVLFDV